MRFGKIKHEPDAGADKVLTSDEEGVASWQEGGGGGEVPSGGIIMWSGSIANIPSGWYLCNGSNGTPDLRDRFVICATEDDSGTAKTNVTGSLTVSGNGTIPSHTHTVSAIGSGNYIATMMPGSQTQSPSSLTTSAAGTGTKNIAVYYALAFIMKE
jgi:microcystin-dependent protein